jgi:hypothetical protein
MTSENVEGFLELRALINGCDDFVSRILTIQQYTAYDKDFSQDVRVRNYDQFVSHQDIDAKIFWDNFSWKSNTFRHAVRVAFATTLGFVVSEFSAFGHGYWIMLTIIVILKPAYRLQKKEQGPAVGNYYRSRYRGDHFVAGEEKQLMIGIMSADGIGI